MALTRPVWKQVRERLTAVLSTGNVELQGNTSLRARALHKLADIVNLLPVKIGDYSDFYASKEHASNMGKMFRPDQEPLLPNWSLLPSLLSANFSFYPHFRLWIPIGYHGRSSSVVVSGTPIHRPYGQVKPPVRSSIEVSSFLYYLGNKERMAFICIFSHSSSDCGHSVFPKVGEDGLRA